MTNVLKCCIAADCTILLNRFTRKNSQVFGSNRKISVHKNEHHSVINTHYNLHNYIQHHNGYRVFPGVKVRPGRAADHSPSSSAAVMKQ